MGSVDQLAASRAVGGALFASQRYSESIVEYNRAVDLATDSKTRGLLVSNRAACFLSLGKYAEAASEAKRAIALDASHGKSWYRLAKARMGLGLGAVSAASRAVQLSPHSREARQLAKRAKQAYLLLYKEVPEDEAKRAVWRLKEECLSTLTEFEECFGKVLRPDSFVATVFPGSSDPPKRSLREFLDDPQYATATERCWPRAKERARAVLAGVERRGLEEEGVLMDETTRAELWPKILRESLARELATAAREVTLEKALTRLPTANTVIDFPYVAAKIDDFMGIEWARAAADDAVRIKHFTSHTTQADTAWLDGIDQDEFPALAELVARVLGIQRDPDLTKKAIPISSHLPSQRGHSLAVIDPSPQAPLLERLASHHRPVTFTSDTSDHLKPALSLLYFMPPGDSRAHLYLFEDKTAPLRDDPQTRGGGLVLWPRAGADMDGSDGSIEIAPKSDTLLLWRSDSVMHRRVQVLDDAALRLSVRHWLFCAS